jgi:hypothetical protein
MTLDTATDADAAAAPGGLLDLAPATEVPAAPPAGHPAATSPAPAETAPTPQGEAKPAQAKAAPARPEGLPDAFWDADKGEVKLAELIKSQADLRRIVSRGEHKPPPTPDDYKLPANDKIPADLITPDDPLWKATTAAAHARGFSQADLEALATPFLTTLAELTKDARPMTAEQAKAAQEQAMAAEMAKLGQQGPAIIRGVDTWLKGLAAKQVITTDELAALRATATADGVRALAKLRELAGERSLGINAGAAPEIGSEEEARALLRQGFAAGGEQTDAGRALLEKGRDMLRRLEAAGVTLGTVRQPR